MTLEEALSRIEELEEEIRILRTVQVVHHYHHAGQIPALMQPQQQYLPVYPIGPYIITCGNSC